MKGRLLCFFLVFALAWPFSAVAARDQEGAGEYSLEEVVVTAGRIEQQKKNITSNITVIDRDEIEKSPADNLGDLLAEKGIGHINQYPGALTSFGIRGFRTDSLGRDLLSHVIVLLDGRRANTVNLAKIMTENIERVEIIRGPGAVQYGSAGMGGVVNVITRRGDRNSVFLETGFGSYGEKKGVAGGTAKIKGLDFSGSLTCRDMNDYDTGAGERYENTGYDGKYSLSVNAGYEFMPGNRIGVIFTGFRVNEAGNPDYFKDVDRDNYSDKSYYSVDAIYTGRDSANRLRWMARYFQGRDENKWVDPLDSNPTGWDDGIPFRRDTDQHGIQAQLSFDMGDNIISDSALVTAGIDWVGYDIHVTSTPQNSSYRDTAGFVLVNAFFFDKRLVADVGFRHDWYYVDMKDDGHRDHKNHLTPKAGLAWVVNKSLKFRCQYAEGFRMPAADELAADYQGWIKTVGNPDLDPEKSRTYEGGTDFDAWGLSASLTWFHTDYDDKIQSTYTASGNKTWENVGSATMEGLEAAFSWDMAAIFKWSWEVRPYLNLVWMSRYEDDDTGEDLQYTPDLTASYGITFSDYEGFSARMNLTYHGSERITDWEAGYPYPEINKGGFTVADLILTKQIINSLEYGSLTVKGELRNMFDREYSFVKGYPMPGRSVFVSVRWEY